MNHIVILLLVIFFSIVGCTNAENQSVNVKENLTDIETRTNKQLENDIKFYIESLNHNNFEDLTSLIYPGLFGVKSRKDHKEDLIKQKIYGVTKKIELHKIESISPIYTFKDNLYSKIDCTGDVILHLANEALENIENIKIEFELSYDTNEVIAKEDQLVIEDAYFSFIAIKNKGKASNVWTYIEVDKQKEPFYDSILPVEILNKF